MKLPGLRIWKIVATTMNSNVIVAHYRRRRRDGETLTCGIVARRGLIRCAWLKGAAALAAYALSVVAALAGYALAAPPAEAPQATRRDPEVAYRSEILPWLKKNCLDCHGPDLQEGDVRFDRYKDAAAVADDRKTWERVIEMLRSGAMPPEDSPQPSEAERKKLVHWIERAIYNFDCDGPIDPGRVTIRRLNRAEYNNTVRDLLGITFRPADDFPSDDVGGGFDNIGDVLTLPPLLMEKYLAAAERIAEEVVITDPSVFVKSQFRFREQLRGDGSASYDFSQNARRWTIYSDGSVYHDFEFPAAGKYRLRAVARGEPAGDEPPKMELRIDGQPVKAFDVDAYEQRGRYETTCEVPAGTHRLSAHFLNDFQDPAAKDPRRRDRNLLIDSMEVDGPLDPRPEDYPATHRAVVAILPGEGRSVAAAARGNLQPLLLRAFRRPATEAEVQRFVALVTDAVREGDSFELGMQVALTAVLVSPHFLFRAEGDAAARMEPRSTGARAGEGERGRGGEKRTPVSPSPSLPLSSSSSPSSSATFTVRPLSDYELASRLSYFIWSSMPDGELFDLAAAGKLRDPATLKQQARRLLADRKSEALVQNFFTQWLNLRLLDGVTPDPQVFPGFDAALKTAMRRETELFAAAVVHEDRSVLDFLTGRFTFVNERLARHYGIAGIQGDEFRRVAFTDHRRTGVLTQASILTLTSNPGRTSPVKRGKWMLENILGSPPPDPPPDAPDLDAVQKAKPNASLRQQLEIHRENAVCASCHKVMDQLGFGLENFDAIGRWRDKDAGFPIDASGELPGGAKFNGPLALAKVLDRRRDEFVRCLSEKLLTFALGRELVVPDRCAVDKIVEQVKAEDYRFSALVTAIATSDPFCKTRSEE